MSRGLGDVYKRQTDSLAAMNRTFIICKPDAVERGLVGQILSRFETKGFSIVAAELRTLDADTLARHYEEHVGKGFYDDLVAFMSRGPALVAVIEGPEGTWETVREMMGATNPMTSAPGTIRGDYSVHWRRNLVHGSDSVEAAARELSLWFEPHELIDWERAAEPWVHEL